MWHIILVARLFLSGVIAVIVAQLAITYVPALQAIFGTQAVAFSEGLLVVGIGVALFVLV